MHIPDVLDKPLLWLALAYRRLRYGYAFRKIPLTQGKFAIVDPQDYERLSAIRWHAHQGPQTWYAVHSLTNGKKEKRKNLQMHNMVIDVPDGMFADHINHDGLDNRKANLRAVTHMQNVWNRRKFSGRTSRGVKKPSRSKYKGVDWASDMNKWRARIRVNGKRIYLGSFESELDAARAYDEAAKQHHGDFAALNFPSSAAESSLMV